VPLGGATVMVAAVAGVATTNNSAIKIRMA
jgi:hypothetical protein